MFAFFDGDNIGKNIEILLLEGRIGEATLLSQNITYAMEEIENFLKTLTDIQIIIIGGDDVLINFNEILYNISILKEVSGIFYKKTGLTMSCGLGKNIPQSIYNLHLAKLYGKNQIFENPREIP